MFTSSYKMLPSWYCYTSLKLSKQVITDFPSGIMLSKKGKISNDDSTTLTFKGGQFFRGGEYNIPQWRWVQLLYISYNKGVSHLVSSSTSNSTISSRDNLWKTSNFINIFFQFPLFSTLSYLAQTKLFIYHVNGHHYSQKYRLQNDV